jgi:hypothetical protein
MDRVLVGHGGGEKMKRIGIVLSLFLFVAAAAATHSNWQLDSSEIVLPVIVFNPPQIPDSLSAWTADIGRTTGHSNRTELAKPAEIDVRPDGIAIPVVNTLTLPSESTPINKRD